MLTAAGDWGNVAINKQGNLVPYSVVLYPASDPLVTSVSGTWFQYGWRWDPLISAATYYSTADVGSYLNWLDTHDGRTEAVWKEEPSRTPASTRRARLTPVTRGASLVPVRTRSRFATTNARRETNASRTTNVPRTALFGPPCTRLRFSWASRRPRPSPEDRHPLDS